MGALGMAVVLGLGCGGIMNDAAMETISEDTLELRARVPDTDPNRAAVEALLEDQWLAAHEGVLSTSDVIVFGAALATAIEDGAVDDAELAELQGKVGWTVPALDPARRAELLAQKAAMDAEEAQKAQRTSRPAPASAGKLADWTLPDDLRIGLEAAGWEVFSCVDDLEDGEHWVECDADKGTTSASVEVTRYKSRRDVDDEASEGEAVRTAGKTELRVTVLDGTAGAALLDALVGSGPLAKVDVRKGLKAAGYRVSGCSEEREDGVVIVACDAERQGRAAVASLATTGDGDGTLDVRAPEHGNAMATQGDDELTVIVMDEAAAGSLADALTQR
ncbi:MAG: hypothetical protein H6738_03410 [Alphaproteobacteria bacterium]|nr:hypothetical protein [Alphaproteobacteria bacterium]MCB9695815.1 hypothetical protein [Alphaproteobacteria bacterium]